MDESYLSSIDVEFRVFFSRLTHSDLSFICLSTWIDSDDPFDRQSFFFCFFRKRTASEEKICALTDTRQIERKKKKYILRKSKNGSYAAQFFVFLFYLLIVVKVSRPTTGTSDLILREYVFVVVIFS